MLQVAQPGGANAGSKAKSVQWDAIARTALTLTMCNNKTRSLIWEIL